MSRYQLKRENLVSNQQVLNTLGLHQTTPHRDLQNEDFSLLNQQRARICTLSPIKEVT